jgi:integrase
VACQIFCDVALDADLVEANPCHRLKKRGVENVGRRVLSDSEIRLFWSGIVEPERSRRTGLGLRLALLLGARVGEIAGLARCELAHIDDPARAAWTIPATRVKNGRDHLLPLPPLARDTVLELLSLIGPDEQFLFPTRSGRRNGPMRSNSLTQAMDFFSKRVARDSREKTWDAEPPTPHDLRRTLETRLAELRYRGKSAIASSITFRPMSETSTTICTTTRMKSSMRWRAGRRRCRRYCGAPERT